MKAGIQHCRQHGLRKALSRRLAESRVTTPEARAITGHKTDKEFQHYAEKVSKADHAMANLAERYAKKG